jgi:RHH-type proline utilization regulon transcriptional repressor/proline dehydrogenase/delta 1-pyrroline-5-carboxylate dehydrogenase
LLCVQNDVANTILPMLKDALLELRIGDPRRLATDVGPVITAAARDMLVAHIEHMRSLRHRVFQAPLSAECANGTFVAPTVIELAASTAFIR